MHMTANHARWVRLPSSPPWNVALVFAFNRTYILAIYPFRWMNWGRLARSEVPVRNVSLHLGPIIITVQEPIDSQGSKWL